MAINLTKNAVNMYGIYHFGWAPWKAQSFSTLACKSLGISKYRTSRSSTFVVRFMQNISRSNMLFCHNLGHLHCRRSRKHTKQGFFSIPNQREIELLSLDLINRKIYKTVKLINQLNYWQ